jgi:hypothetical protein
MSGLSFTRLSLVTFALLIPVTSYAGDSTWLLCRGIAEHGAGADRQKTHMVASLHEHRGAKGDGRDLSVTLIYGDHVGRGEVIGKDGGDEVGKQVPVKLSSIDGKKRPVFTGTSELAQDMNTVTLTGSIDWTFGQDAKAKMVPFSGKLNCKQLDDQAIGQ